MPELLKQLKYDVAIVGTGLASSVLAASLSITGSTILHLDPQPFYGSTSATLSLQDWDAAISDDTDPAQLHDSAQTEESNTRNVAELVREAYGEEAEFVPLKTTKLRDAAFPFGIRKWSATAQSDVFESQKKRIFLDIEPRGLYAAGRMTSLLERTNVGHYVTFKALEAIYVDFGYSGIQKVPASRSDIFQNKFVSMVEKRLLMRFLKKAVDGNDADEDDDCDTFEESMRQACLTEKIKTMVRYAIAFTGGDKNVSVKKGQEAIKLYQQSLARFGTPTPFLWTNYGSGDLSEAFCRLCAVNGGVYILGRNIKGFVCKSDKQIGIVTSESEFVHTGSLYLEAPLFIHQEMNQENCTWRFTAIIDKSIVKDQGRVMIIVPRGTAGNQKSTVHIIQFDHSLMVCPPNMYVLYAETTDADATEEDLTSALSRIVRLNKTQVTEAEELPGILWAASYAVGRDQLNPDLFKAAGVHCIRRPMADTTCLGPVNEAERCFFLSGAGSSSSRSLKFFPPTDELDLTDDPSFAGNAKMNRNAQDTSHTSRDSE